MSAILGFFGWLISAVVKAFTMSRDEEMQDAGKVTQKAADDSASLKNAVAARGTDDVVDRMSDAAVRDSNLGSFRD